MNPHELLALAARNGNALDRIAGFIKLGINLAGFVLMVIQSLNNGENPPPTPGPVQTPEPPVAPSFSGSLTSSPPAWPISDPDDADTLRLEMAGRTRGDRRAGRDSDAPVDAPRLATV